MFQKMDLQWIWMIKIILPHKLSHSRSIFHFSVCLYVVCRKLRVKLNDTVINCLKEKSPKVTTAVTNMEFGYLVEIIIASVVLGGVIFAICLKKSVLARYLVYDNS